MDYNSIVSNKDNELLSTSWTAGTNTNALTKLFKRHEIESIDVPETCAKIQMAITEQLSNRSLTSNDLEYRESVGFPFRIATTLCFGTMRLYQQQVQFLLERTQNFFALSTYQVKEFVATKRRSSQQSKNAPKKRRRLETSKNSSITNFTELLHESENIPNWTEDQFETSITQVNSTAVDNQFINCLHSTRLQIREVTIREINIDYNVPGIDDCAFGNATAEELQEFFNVSGDSEIILPQSSKRKTNKRKMPFEENDFDEDVISKSPKISNDKALTENCHLSLIDNNAEGLELQNDLNENLVCNSIFESSQGRLDGININIPVAEVESQLELQNDISAEKNTSVPKIKNKTKHLIVDKLTKLPNEQDYFQFEYYKAKQSIKIDQMQELPKNNFQDPCKLLGTPSRKCVLIRSHNQKFKLSLRSNSTEYIDILNDIFGYSVDTDLIADVYTISAPTRSNRRKRKCEETEENIILSQTEMNNNFFNVIENNEIPRKRTCLTNSQVNFLSKSDNENDTSEEYGTYSVMMKLLDMFRSNPDKNIEANNFIRYCSCNRIQAAQTFNSLLELAKQKLIVIKNKENSCEMGDICLGPASVRLIQNVAVQ